MIDLVTQLVRPHPVAAPGEYATGGFPRPLTNSSIMRIVGTDQ
jgi:hypothetical protein